MSFIARNHPQQVSVNGAVDEVDDRGTTAGDFALFSAEFGPFTLDVAAAPHNAKCDRYFTRADDGLSQSWAGARVWCNPPYSDIRPWVEKAWSEHADTPSLVPRAIGPRSAVSCSSGRLNGCPAARPSSAGSKTPQVPRTLAVRG